ncbi:hypothetical protein [Paenibacillus elgii]|uniref:hypothetical protein n=1 Tax=Paenibacillus elgii TaxID=189691 RepID=UPI0013D59FF9|nr:hypothetical protein [Paenibacillus elgii]
MSELHIGLNCMLFPLRPIHLLVLLQGKMDVKFEGVEIESVQVDPGGKKGSATYRLRYSFSSVSYSKNPQPSQLSETTLQITDQLIRDEYGHWLFDWNSRDTHIVEDKLL